MPYLLPLKIASCTIIANLYATGVLSIHLRGGSPFKEEPGLILRIYGEAGEIQVTASGAFLQVGYPDMKIKLHSHATDEVEEVKWETSSTDESLPTPARNVARMYEAYANGESIPNFEAALKRHRLLEAVYKSSEASTSTSYT